jgi:hypothetical protein
MSAGSRFVEDAQSGSVSSRGDPAQVVTPPVTVPSIRIATHRSVTSPPNYARGAIGMS